MTRLLPLFLALATPSGAPDRPGAPRDFDLLRAVEATLARPAAEPPRLVANAALDDPAAPAEVAAPSLRKQVAGAAQTVAIFGLMSLVPAALLMLTAFVRISIVLALLRQALGSPQVPGAQVTTALAFLLTALVMRPVAEDAYARGIKPYLDGRLAPAAAWEAGVAPLRGFMIDQIVRTRHEDYVWTLYDHAGPHDPSTPEPDRIEQVPLRVLAPAFLISELTTALFLGFAIYLPFLVIDLVVSAVLSAMGLFLLPPALVALPLKLILFALADGWMLVSGMLLRSFSG